MKVGMMSFENLVAIQLASHLIKNPEINKEIFCVSEHVGKCGFQYEEGGTVKFTSCSYHTQLWYDVMRSKIKSLVEKYLTQHLQVKVIGAVFFLALQMLKWKTYHMRILNLPETYHYITFLSSCLNHQGIIDNKMAANHLMRDENLNFKQKYKLACIYCFTENIPLLYKLMTEEDRKEIQNPSEFEKIKQPPMIKFWTYHCSGKILRLTDSINIYEYMLDKAIKSGSLAAVDYALKRINFRNSDILVEAALKAFGIYRTFQYHDYNFTFDCCACNPPLLWVPSDYYLEIVCFLLLKMTKFQQIQFMLEDINFPPFTYTSRVLESFLDWPYQNYFLRVVEIMWEYLPESTFSSLLIKICHKINNESLQCTSYVADMCYNYNNLLREFWCQSPESYKKNIFAYDGEDCDGATILSLLFSRKTLTNEDIENIQLILSAVPDEVSETLCTYLLKRSKWITLHVFMHSIFRSEDKIKSFKKSVFSGMESSEIK